MIKICPKCKKEFDAKVFKCGLKESYCKECKKKYNEEVDNILIQAKQKYFNHKDINKMLKEISDNFCQTFSPDDEVLAALEEIVNMWDSPDYKLCMKPLIDRAKELLKRRRNGQGKGDGWISVEERLPENQESVLVWNSRFKEVFQATFYVGRKETVENYFRLRGGYTGKVTHWMPLPKEPSEVKG